MCLAIIDEYDSDGDLGTSKKDLRAYMNPFPPDSSLSPLPQHTCWHGGVVPILDPPSTSANAIEKDELTSFDVDLESLSGRTVTNVRELEHSNVSAPCVVSSAEESLGIDLTAVHPVPEALLTVGTSPGHFAVSLHRLVSVIALRRSEIFKYLSSAILVSGLVGYFVNQIPPLRT